MKSLACDYHPSFQQIAMLDHDNGELSGRRLAHPAEAEAFYRGLQGPVRVGMEAIGNALWFGRLMAVRAQKTDARDVAHWLDHVESWMRRQKRVVILEMRTEGEEPCD